MGPSQEHAHRRADEVVDQLLLQLKDRHYIGEPRGPFSHNLKDDHEKAKAQLREAMRELFWIEACDSF